MLARQAVVLCVCLTGALVLGSCSSGPKAPAQGTPEWYWNAAAEQFSRGDFVKTQESLEKLMASDNPYKRRAAAWHLVVLGGLAKGNKELADAYEAGSTASKTRAGEFRRVMGEVRRQARLYSIGLAQEVERFQKEFGDAPKIPLEFSFPRGSATEVIMLDRVRKGIMPPEGERALALQRMLERGVLLETAAVVGAGMDTAKAAEMFKRQPAETPRVVFLHAVASSLVDQASLFDRKKLNEPDKKKILLEMASSCLKAAGDQDEALKKKAKDLQEKIDKEQKALSKG